MESYYKSKPLKKLILHPNFKKTIEGIRKINPNFMKSHKNFKINVEDIAIFKNKDVQVSVLEKNLFGRHKMNATNGEGVLNKYIPLYAYDESVSRFDTLEGVAYMFSHSIVMLTNDEYIPNILISAYFYTRSKTMFRQNPGVVTYVGKRNPEEKSKEDYIKEKIEFIKSIVNSNALIFIDGPLIGGNWYVYMITAIRKFFNSKNIFPIFFVKNSQSSRIVNTFKELAGKYNSDLDWANHLLNKGERTSFFFYKDLRNPQNNRVFCYLKAFNNIPQRIEMHNLTYYRIKDKMDDIMNIIYYLLLTQGDPTNPQIRPIAIAEKYARETLNLFNLELIIKSAGLTPTVNQERFGW